MKAGKGLPEDIAEFGDRTVAGAPSIAELILALPEDQRAAYREERRATLRNLGWGGTYRSYLEAR